MKLRIFDLSRVSPISPPVANGGANTNGSADRTVIPADAGFEVGPGVHQGPIKSIVWTRDPNVLVTAADDKLIRWWDLRTRTVVQEQAVNGVVGTCEFTNVKSEATDIGAGLPVLTIAAGNNVYFYGGNDARTLLKTVTLPYEVASAALHPSQRKFITGGIKDPWAHVYDYDSVQELGKSVNASYSRLTGTRSSQRPSWTNLEYQLLTGRKAVRNWKRRRHNQDVEELQWAIWLVAS